MHTGRKDTFIFLLVPPLSVQCRDNFRSKAGGDCDSQWQPTAQGQGTREDSRSSGQSRTARECSARSGCRMHLRTLLRALWRCTESDKFLRAFLAWSVCRTYGTRGERCPVSLPASCPCSAHRFFPGGINRQRVLVFVTARTGTTTHFSRLPPPHGAALWAGET